jgi:hypothetical protein
MTLMDILRKRWYVIIAIFVIIIFLLNWFGFITIIGKESFSTLRLYELNESVIPQGHTISLTEEDFKEFPQLGSIIRDKNSKPTVISKMGIRSYEIPFSSEEYDRFIARYWSNVSRSEVDRPFPHNRIFEYKGKYYEYDLPQIH